VFLISISISWIYLFIRYTRSENEVREVATACLPWQQWAETSVWFDDVGKSAFQSCVVVLLWQSLPEWRRLMSECVLMCRRENVGAWIRTLSVREFLARKQITMLEHRPYSPDLATNYFFLFPKIKEILKGRHFDDTDDIRSNTTAGLKVISQNQFKNCFEGCTRRWHRYIASQGE
jgi:transposase